MRERIVFHVDMNAFFAAVEQRFNPGLRGKPIAVCGNPKSRTVVAACSYEAKAFGIKNGMSVYEARQLCPTLILVAGTPGKYVDVAQRLFAILAEYAPEMEVFSIDEAFLDVTWTYQGFAESPEALARRIKSRVRETYGLTCSVGIGPNKLIAKLASSLQKPDGLVRVRPEEVPGLLATLPVERLCGIGERLKAILNDLGIVTCADLGAAPEELLVSRCGIMVGGCLKRMGRGIDESPVLPYHIEAGVKSMGHSYTLPRDTGCSETIHGTLLRLSEQVARRLRADGYQGRTVSLTVRYADFTGLTRHRTLACPTDAGLMICRAAQGLFQASCEPLPQRVRLLGVGVSLLTRHERQLSFLDEEQRMERLDRCLDRLADRYGEFTVVRASAWEPLTPKSHGFLLKRSRQRQGLMLR